MLLKNTIYKLRNKIFMKTLKESILGSTNTGKKKFN